MQVCYEYVGLVKMLADLGAEAWAAWLSAIGGLIAVGLTAGFYFKDRREQIRTGRVAAAEHRRERAYRAWKLALRIFPIVEGGVRHYEFIAQQLSDPSFNGNVPAFARAQWEAVDTKRLDELMSEMSDLSRDTQAKLIFFTNMLVLMRTQFDRWTVSTAGVLVVNQLTQFVPDIRKAIQAGEGASRALEGEVSRNGYAAND